MVKVSVIIPVYNVEKYLKKCLNSLVNQTFKDYEIIVVNDGSPDNSQKIMEEFAKKYPKLVRIYKKKNGGVASARNFGLEKAKGEYISFVDSDDYVDKKYLSTLYETAIRENADIVACDIFKKTDETIEIMKGYDAYSDDATRNLMVSIPAVWNKLFKRSLFVDNGISFPSASYCEDLAVVSRTLCSASKVAYAEIPLYYYLIRTGSITHQVKYNPKTADVFHSLDVVRKYYKEQECYDMYRDELEFLHIVHLLHGYMMCIYKYDECLSKIEEVVDVMKENFPNWQKNKYYKKESLKYKLVCNLLYKKQIPLLRLILKK